MKSAKSKKSRKRVPRKPKFRAHPSPVKDLPYVTIDWTRTELEHLMVLEAAEPAKPTEALVRLMKG